MISALGLQLHASPSSKGAAEGEVRETMLVPHFPGARDLLEPLAGAPAARFLEKAIQHDEEQRGNRQEWKRSQTLEAVEQRRI